MKDKGIIPRYSIKNTVEKYKRDFIIKKQIARHFVQYSDVFQTPLTLYVTQMVNPFLIPRISVNHDKGEEY